MRNPKLEDKIFNSCESTFRETALQVFEYQYRHLLIFRRWCDLLGKTPANVADIYDIPFLPIEYFRSHEICTEQNAERQLLFESSGSTSANASRHIVTFPEVYERSLSLTFQQVFGATSEILFLSLLPNYLEKGNSSLVYMMDYLHRRGAEGSNFYLHNFNELSLKLKQAIANGEKVILTGVGYALLDFADEYAMPLPDVTILETGGMKGRRKELTKAELHDRLLAAFPGAIISSEYGMTELLSQAYLINGRFTSPPWMKIIIRQLNDPFAFEVGGRTGGINVIDLANVYSCSFIETKDLGRQKEDGFEVLGRYDSAEMRGCSLLIN